MLSVCLQQEYEYVHLLLSCKPAAKPSICILLFHFAACLFSFPSLLLYICSMLLFCQFAAVLSQFRKSKQSVLMSVCCWC